MGNATRTLLALAGLAAAMPGTAQATQYPYCMSHVQGWAGMIELCDYTTMAQCQASALGLNGMCAPNWRLAWNHSQPVDAATPVVRKKRIHH
ncbi:hypothetical protein BH10PSE10_BH10PSE10_15640 [soil metagenome]